MCDAKIVLFNICISRFNTFSRSIVKAAKGLRKPMIKIPSIIDSKLMPWLSNLNMYLCNPVLQFTLSNYSAHKTFKSTSTYSTCKYLVSTTLAGAPIIRLLASSMSAQKGNGNPLESNLKKGWVHIQYEPKSLLSNLASKN